MLEVPAVLVLQLKQDVLLFDQCSRESGCEWTGEDLAQTLASIGYDVRMRRASGGITGGGISGSMFANLHHEFPLVHVRFHGLDVTRMFVTVPSGSSCTC